MYPFLTNYISNADAFHKLWLVSHLLAHQDGNQGDYYSSDSWHPELVEAFSSPSIVPVGIKITDEEHQFDSEYRYHPGRSNPRGRKPRTTPTLKVGRMEVFWKSPNDGPVAMIIDELQMWHHQGELHRKNGDAIIAKCIKFKWKKEGGRLPLHRPDGPAVVTFTNYTAKAEKGSPTTETRYKSIRTEWGSSDGVRFSDEDVVAVLTKHRIYPNFMMAGESVFEDEMASFIFWEELGRVRDKKR